MNPVEITLKTLRLFPSLNLHQAYFNCVMFVFYNLAIILQCRNHHHSCFTRNSSELQYSNHRTFYQFGKLLYILALPSLLNSLLNHIKSVQSKTCSKDSSCGTSPCTSSKAYMRVHYLYTVNIRCNNWCNKPIKRTSINCFRIFGKIVQTIPLFSRYFPCCVNTLKLISEYEISAVYYLIQLINHGTASPHHFIPIFIQQ